MLCKRLLLSIQLVDLISLTTVVSARPSSYNRWETMEAQCGMGWHRTGSIEWADVAASKLEAMCE